MPDAVNRKSYGRVIYPLLAGLALLQGGCLLAIAGVCAGGAATGYFYAKGRIYRDYPAGLPAALSAAEAALADLHFLLFTRDVKDGKAFLVTKTASGKKVRIYLDCLPSPIPAEGLVTRVSIRVATFGDESVSARILEQIAWRLAHPNILAPTPQPAPPPPGPPVPIQPTSNIQPVSQTSEPPVAVQPVKKK